MPSLRAFVETRWVWNAITLHNLVPCLFHVIRASPRLYCVPKTIRAEYRKWLKLCLLELYITKSQSSASFHCMIGPHPAALWYVHCGNGLLRLWEQQSHSTPASCRCECFFTTQYFTERKTGLSWWQSSRCQGQWGLCYCSWYQFILLYVYWIQLMLSPISRKIFNYPWIIKHHLSERTTVLVMTVWQLNIGVH